jgi:hypothetical protein
MGVLTNLKRRKWIWFTILILIILIKLFAHNDFHVEKFYARGYYYYESILLRYLYGSIPFSLGDILYLLAGSWLFWKLFKNGRLLFRKRLTRQVIVKKMAKLLILFGTVYVIFNILWGLNYNRKGIAWQLHLPKVSYNSSNLIIIQDLLLQKVNETKMRLIRQQVHYPSTEELFKRAKICYNEAANDYPFLQYKNVSVKSSLYGKLGDYLGFTGYYNPFTGEAQVNTTVPRFLQPYITLHEMGHQLGYAKEDEANFSGYLAAANCRDTLFQYSAYLDLYLYANREVFYLDSAAARLSAKQLIPEVKADLLEWRRFNERYTSFLEPAVNWMYGKYLEVNQQPKGLRSYNEVVAALIAYYKKFGKL